MGGQEVDIVRREGDPGKAVQAGRMGKRLNIPTSKYIYKETINPRRGSVSK